MISFTRFVHKWLVFDYDETSKKVTLMYNRFIFHHFDYRAYVENKFIVEKKIHRDRFSKQYFNQHRYISRKC